MAGRPFTAIVAPRPEAARAVHERSDRGEAVAVLDPTTPPATLGRLLRTLAPTHLVDPDVVCLPLHASSPPDLDTLRTFARHQLARAQLPKQLVLVEGIPRSPGGKVLRRKLGPPE